MMKTKTVRKIKTHFEQVPLAIVRKVVSEDMGRSAGHLPACAICGNPVELEKCKTDERGDAVHDACYVSRVTPVKDASVIETRFSQAQSVRP